MSLEANMYLQCETEVTLSIGNDEADYSVRANVLLDRCEAYVHGDVEVYLDGRWVSLTDLPVDDGDIELATDAVCDVALEER
jgi:hypothetical protein